MAPAVQQSGGGGGGGSTAAVGSTTRWCPTAEQLMILEEMYRGGLRTPNAAQIQQITAHLSSYGRIEGKNVFYWFQNHKARDRQKLRRRLCISHHLLSCAHYYAAAHAHHLALSPTAAAAIPPPPLSSPLAAAPPLLPLHPSSCGAGLDHPNSLLSPTSATTPTAAAAYTTSFYYPFATATAAAAAPPPPRTSPASPLFHYNQGGGGVVLPAAEAIGRSSDYSLGKLVDNFGVALEEAFPTQPQTLATTMTAVVDTAPATAVAAGGFCRPLKTLDLFPGGLKEEQHDVV